MTSLFPHIRRAAAGDRDALLVDPAHFRKGAGKRMLAHARALKGPLTVEVNEQNPQGLAFYLQSGFVQAGRSERDSAGRPFPILHLREERA